ncbi:MAG TPA: TolC family protein [Candidatus Sulfotelmatobacter sp.]|nr:TolC family protein [Candidatus Sulfotelmatobacter sp.]
MHHKIHLGLIVLLIGNAALTAKVCAGQQPDAPAPQPQAMAKEKQATAPSSPAPGAPLRLTLQDALALARKNEPTYQSVVTAAGVAGETRAQTRDALLPSVNFTTSAISTQSSRNGTTGVIFIANNAPHEYISQGNVHQQLDLASWETYRSSAAQAAAAKARAEVAARGLVVTVVQNYFAAAAAGKKLESASRTADEGEKFLQLTQALEKGGEVAHSDVIKADLQAQERRRQLQEAKLGLLNARLDLAVLLFPDFNDKFEIGDDLHGNVALPPQPEFEAQAAQGNPDIRAALAVTQAAAHDVNAARAGYLPTISLDYFYGIDAPNYAVNSIINPGNTKVSNIGSSAIATLNLPVWNWGATQSRVRSAELQRDQAKRELSFAQRKLLAEMRSLYSEAETALNELAGLQRSAELSEESLRLTTMRYQGGEATVLEVVDAQTTFAQASAAYQDGAVRYRVALANLQTLTGVLTTP